MLQSKSGIILRRLATSLLRIALMLVVGLAAYFKLFGNRLIFYPETTIAAVPCIPYEDVIFTAGDGTKLNGWFMPFTATDRVFVISHGNAGNIGDRSEMGEYVSQELRSAVFMYDYRGYGRSEGKPSESGLYSDLRGALRYVRARGYALDKIYLIGQSLGTAVTVEVASQEDVAGIILEAPFPGVREIARSYAFSIPVDFFLSARFDSASKIQAVRAPIAVIHGRRDPVIPFVLGQQLFEIATGPKQFFAVEGEIHEGALMALGVEQTQRLREFLFKKNE
jgi:uncharacterized protein